MIATRDNVDSIRKLFLRLKKQEQYVTDKSGCKMLEVLGATFVADEEAIFGVVNRNYVDREIEWYKSQSLNINAIQGGAPAAWRAAADPNGWINSNYGWMIWSESNHRQYDHVLNELKEKPKSRRATMIYTRPSIWDEYNKNGMSDFICTSDVQYFIRDGKLLSFVRMRSNDVLYGYKNDKAFQDYVHQSLAKDLGVEVGDMVWHVGSLHVYQKHFDLIQRG